MTEEEWLACNDHTKLFEYLSQAGTTAHRSYRLFLTACCRAFLPDLLTDERTHRLIEMAEDYANGSVGTEELARAKRVALDAVRDNPQLDSAIRGVAHGLPRRQAVDFPFFCLNSWDTSNYNRPTDAQQRRLCTLIRDIFGNPFRPVTMNPSWLTSTVVSLASGIYQDKAFDRLPILADALMDSGCDHPEILQHCHSPGPHVKGCWIVDLLLLRGKS